MKEIKRALDAKEANIMNGYEDEVVSRYRAGMNPETEDLTQLSIEELRKRAGE